MGKAPAGHSLAMLSGATGVQGHQQEGSAEPVARLASGRGGSAAITPPAPAALTPQSLYETHFAFVWRSLRHLGLPDGVMEDAAQDVFLVVHRRWESFDARWSAVETWLFGILMRVAKTYRRTAKRRAWATPSGNSLGETVPATDDGPTELAARREAAALLGRLLAALKEHKRAIVVLVDIEQMSVPQAAEALGINLNAAHWRLRAARAELKRALLRIRATESRHENSTKEAT